MKVAVVGTGYVGLVTGTCLAESGNEVTCVDNNPKKIDTLNGGGMPIYEPGLSELVASNRKAGRLAFTTDLTAAVKAARLIFIAVGTPQSDAGDADLTAVWAVAKAIAVALKSMPAGPPGSRVVITKSTVPVGTNQRVAEILVENGCPHVDVASNPEFLKEGAAIDDFMKPDRVVVGVRKPEVGEVLRELYAPFLRTERPFLVMTPESAEMTKYAANAMLATKISFINEMANLCDKLGADINDVRRGIGHDQRIGFQFLFPGPGYGGSCFEGGETLFVEEGGQVRTRTFEEVWQRVAEPARVVIGAGGSEIEDEAVVPDNLRVLATDLTTREIAAVSAHAFTRRWYCGSMVTIRTSMWRTLRVTADHPIVVWENGQSRIVPAHEVQPGDRIAAVTRLPAAPAPAPLNLIDLLTNTPLDPDVLVRPDDDSFTRQYPKYVAHIPATAIKHPVEIRDHNRMRLRLYRKLTHRGVLDVPPERLALYTAKGAATTVPAAIDIDADFVRLIGYYLAGGGIAKETGRAGAVRERIGFSFHENETEYIADVQRVLSRYGVKFAARTSTHATTTYTSSRVFAWLLRDVLGCGTRSEDKRLPAFAFALSDDLKRELLRGAFSGAGSVIPVKGGRNFVLEYGTVSRQLADGLALLLQSVGVVVSVAERWMNQSKRPAFILRVSGYQQLERLKGVFGDKHRARIETLLAGYERRIKQRGFDHIDGMALLTVRSVETEFAEQPVYSVETATGTVVVGSGLLVHNCFPKDIRAIIGMGRKVGQSMRMMQSVDDVNEAQKQVLFQKVKAHFGGQLSGKTLALWGLAFKPRTDDIREAPALVLIDALLANGVKVRVHDPEAMANVREQYGDKLDYYEKPYGALEGADGLVIVTEWQEFRAPDFEVMKRLLAAPVIFDGRNIYDEKAMAGYGFTYYAIGRGKRV
jgi:UDPglucose 6-dehydrogenase